MRLHSYYEIICKCGRTIQTEDAKTTCSCGRELIILWPAPAKQAAPKVTPIDKVRAA